MSDLAVLQEKLGYEFKDITLLERALTHSTVAEKDYQKLEFLGDALLDFVVADYLLLTYPEESEDFATRKRASVVAVILWRISSRKTALSTTSATRT